LSHLVKNKMKKKDGVRDFKCQKGELYLTFIKTRNHTDTHREREREREREGGHSLQQVRIKEG
jgi:hypothetical protein